ncbi:MAG: UPF0149 family protein [Rubrivivax sp.]
MIPGSTAVAPPRRNSEAELDAFEDACMRLAGFDHTLTPYHVDGWLIAFACGPVRPPAETWLPLLAGDAFDRAFADPPDRAQALAALQSASTCCTTSWTPRRCSPAPTCCAWTRTSTSGTTSTGSGSSRRTA